MHSSIQLNTNLKSCVTLVLLVLISALAFGCMAACIDSATMQSGEMYGERALASSAASIPDLASIRDLAAAAQPRIELLVAVTSPVRAPRARVHPKQSVAFTSSAWENFS